MKKNAMIGALVLAVMSPGFAWAQDGEVPPPPPTTPPPAESATEAPAASVDVPTKQTAQPGDVAEDRPSITLSLNMPTLLFSTAHLFAEFSVADHHALQVSGFVGGGYTIDGVTIDSNVGGSLEYRFYPLDPFSGLLVGVSTEFAQVTASVDTVYFGTISGSGVGVALLPELGWKWIVGPGFTAEISGGGGIAFAGDEAALTANLDATLGWSF